VNINSNKKCCQCDSVMTIDEEYRYKILCYKCCASAWASYENAHGGSCSDDIHKRHVTKEIKNSIISRDNNTCLKCGSTKNLNVDHITPLSRGGDNGYDNLQTLCSSCNSKKGMGIADYRESF